MKGIPEKASPEDEGRAEGGKGPEGGSTAEGACSSRQEGSAVDR